MPIKCGLNLLAAAVLVFTAAGCWKGGPAGAGRDDLRSVRENAEKADTELDRSLQKNQEKRKHKDIEKDLEDEARDIKKDMRNMRQDSVKKPDSDSTRAPGWITSPPARTTYVYGVGSAQIYSNAASAINRAQDDARSELLKRLEVTVSGETRTSAARRVKNGKSRITRSVMNRVKTEVAETRLTHVEIVDTYADQSAGVAYALVRLDREAARADLTARIKEIDSRLNEIASLKNAGSRLDRLKSLLPALPLLEERRAVHSQLDKVTPGAPGHRLPANLHQLENRIANLLNSLVVRLHPRQNSDREMAAGLKKALTAQGVRVREQGTGDLALRYSVDERTLEEDGLWFVFARGNAAILDNNGDIIDEFQKKVKAASRDRKIARSRAIEKLAEKMDQELARSLLKNVERAAHNNH